MTSSSLSLLPFAFPTDRDIGLCVAAAEAAAGSGGCASACCSLLLVLMPPLPACCCYGGASTVTVRVLARVFFLPPLTPSFPVGCCFL